jgi:hypothetical protein
VVLIFLLRVKNIGRDSRRGLTRALPAPTPSPQASAVFDIGEEYEFEIIKEDDGDGCLTLSVRKIQVPPNLAAFFAASTKALPAGGRVASGKAMTMGVSVCGAVQGDW